MILGGAAVQRFTQAYALHFLGILDMMPTSLHNSIKHGLPLIKTLREVFVRVNGPGAFQTFDNFTASFTGELTSIHTLRVNFSDCPNAGFDGWDLSDNDSRQLRTFVNEAKVHHFFFQFSGMIRLIYMLHKRVLCRYGFTPTSRNGCVESVPYNVCIFAPLDCSGCGRKITPLLPKIVILTAGFPVAYPAHLSIK